MQEEVFANSSPDKLALGLASEAACYSMFLAKGGRSRLWGLGSL